MEAILTHENADFDAVASQLGAHKLFPNAIPVLPRRINRNVAGFLSTHGNQLPFVDTKALNGEALSRVIIVDTQHVQSVKGMSAGTAVEVIDHHAAKEPFKKGWHATIELVGATTTIIAERLKTQETSLSSIEATLLGLGIYEDTGFLSFGTTTSRDIQAAAWLLEQGALLDSLREFLRQPLTDDQLELYKVLLSRARTVQGTRETILVASAETEKPVEEIATVVHRLRDALDPAAIFVLVENKSSIQLVARSSRDTVDVGKVASKFGGGGHRRAAAAIITRQNLADVVSLLEAELQNDFNTKEPTVADLMSRGVRTLPADATAYEAESQMRRYGFEGFPVVRGGAVIGLVTRRAIDRAVSHKMKDMLIELLMDAGTVSVAPDDTITTVRQAMNSTGWGQLPVVDSDGSIVGVITRTDVIKYESRVEAKPLNLEPIMARALPNLMVAAMREAGKIASELGSTLFIVGGVVRDLILGGPIGDLDFVVEGDAMALTRALQTEYGGRVITHDRFGTGKWILQRQQWVTLAAKYGISVGDVDNLPRTIDFVAARLEYYSAPTRLPEVERSSIKHDLHRRDFTINTLAIQLDPASFGSLLDFYGGQADLAERHIRVLHSLSFVDDPTRILRAVRLEQRLGFQIEPRTQALINSALPLLDHVSGDRLRHEIEAILREKFPEEILPRLDELSISQKLHPELRWTPKLANGFAAIREAVAAPLWKELTKIDLTLAHLGLWMLPLDVEASLAVCRRLKVKRRTINTIEQITSHRLVLFELSDSVPPSQVDNMLSELDDASLLVVWAASTSETARNQILDYACRMRYIAPKTTGDTLLKRGVKPGRHFATILQSLRAARLDGVVKTDKQEEELLQKLLNQLNPDQLKSTT